MNIEDCIKELKTPSVEEIVTPALTYAGISYHRFTHKFEESIKLLCNKGLAHYLEYSPRMTIPVRTGKTVHDILNLTKEQFLIIPHYTKILPLNSWTYIKKAYLLRTKTLLEQDPTGTKTGELPNTQNTTLEQYITLEDNIVGYRFDGNQGIKNHVVWRSDITRATIMNSILDTGIVKVQSRYYGIGDSNSDDPTSNRHCFRITNIPSLRGVKPYNFLLHNISTYTDTPDHDAQQLALNLSTRHSCGKDEYYTTKASRLTLSFDTRGQRHQAASYSDEKLMCHHIILAYNTIQKVLAPQKEQVVQLFPKPDIKEIAYYFMLRKQVLKERKLENGKIIREPLGDLDIEKLLWDRIKYQNDMRNQKLYDALSL